MMNVVLVLGLATVSVASSLVSYRDIIAANKTCNSKDSCKTHNKFSRMQDGVDWDIKNCFCDHLCAVYGDCCVDARYYDSLEQQTAHKQFTCKELRQFGHLYMKSQCPADWSNDYIRRKCEGDVLNSVGAAGNVDDPVGGLPVTSTSGITYMNYYCAICHGEAANATMWKVRLECPGLKTYKRKHGDIGDKLIYQKLRYNERKRIWGIDLPEGDKLSFFECLVDPLFPETIQHYIRPCRPRISTCPLTWNDTGVKEKCESYSAYVYHFVDAYRNVHCAICNNVTADNLFCSEQKFFRVKVGLSFDFHAFSMLLDVSDVDGSGVVGGITACQEGELFDPFFKKCRRVWCNAGSEYRNGKCVVAGYRSEATTVKMVEIFEDADVTTDLPIVIIEGLPEDNDTAIFKQSYCPKVTFYPGEYVIGDDSIVTINGYDHIFRPSQYSLEGDGSLSVCSFEGDDGLLTIISKFDDSMAYVTAVGVLVSIVCLFIHLIAFAFVPELQNLSGKNMASLSLSLLLAYSLFLLGQLKHVYSNLLGCTVVGAGIYYFFLASFFWMNVLAFDVWRTLKMATTELRSSSGRQTQRFISYCLYGWLIPAILLGVALVCDYVPGLNIPLDFTPGFGVNNCWFSHRWALLVFFATPLGCVMMANIILFLCSSKIVFLSSQESNKLTTCTPRINLKLYIKLAIIMGLTWITGLVAGFLDSTLRQHVHIYRFVWYLFIVFTTFQGLFIFIGFTCTKKVVDSVIDRWIRGKGRRRRSLFLSYSNNSNSSQTTQKTGLGHSDSGHSSLNQSSLEPMVEKT